MCVSMKIGRNATLSILDGLNNEKILNKIYAEE